MLATSLVEDLNCVACAYEQEQYESDPKRARDALERLRFIDTSSLDRYVRDGWIGRDELVLFERFFAFARDRLRPIPDDADAVDWTRADAGWQLVRERANELLNGLDARIDLGVSGWPPR